MDTLQTVHDARITPAWAGKRLAPAPTGFKSQDHPRVGGEKARTLIVQDEPQGSPPRRRGKEGERPAGSNPARITPA